MRAIGRSEGGPSESETAVVCERAAMGTCRGSDDHGFAVPIDHFDHHGQRHKATADRGVAAAAAATEVECDWVVGENTKRRPDDGRTTEHVEPRGSLGSTEPRSYRDPTWAETTEASDDDDDDDVLATMTTDERREWSVASPRLGMLGAPRSAPRDDLPPIARRRCPAARSARGPGASRRAARRRAARRRTASARSPICGEARPAR